MGKEQPKEYYDQIFETSAHYNNPDPQVAPWAPIWNTVVGVILLGNAKTIYDFGCGCGHLCQILYQKGFSGEYKGVDFSSVAIAKSKERNSSEPRATFEVKDISEMDVQAHIKDPASSIVIATEYLEHVAADLEFIAAIPEDTSVIFSVPTFDDPGHERFFKSGDQVLERYGPMLENVQIVHMPSGHFIFTGTKGKS